MITRFTGVCLLCLALLNGCTGGGDAYELELLPDSVMVNVMTDAFILNAAYADTYGQAKDSMALVYSKQLLEKYQLTQEQLDFNVDRLVEDPERFEAILNRMADRVAELERELENFEGDQNPMIE